MPWNPQEHIENLVRHIELVQGACLLLGKRLMAQGRFEFARILISRGFQHDVSKFSGIEWDYLHTGPDVPPKMLELAVQQHRRTNDHHPEFWGGIANMPEIAVAELVCDWYAHSQEFGTGLRAWIEEDAIERYRIDTQGETFRWIRSFVDLLLQNPFAQDLPGT